MYRSSDTAPEAYPSHLRRSMDPPPSPNIRRASRTPARMFRRQGRVFRCTVRDRAEHAGRYLIKCSRKSLYRTEERVDQRQPVLRGRTVQERTQPLTGSLSGPFR